ncbi:Outer membrane protein beta-barrel domain-containing protein [Hymenobacter daecheongensis DSM 21074]|uniref:Outer membrane protein beta-barrel domain-containing protein n=1 Tax=Hymenobacter daecheongensis DSM 21074 TaxID=1121955 RepID=A0A1M6A1B2_9BACT|nr:porin family protein [Hymenobacter daecheongensis]SHI30218.1 Outer membrane protein beta-barrel domain-containing protein [Hymenobacter daecheongensis DSM 21074]
MKKSLLALLLLGASAGAASAQVEIGLKLSPSVAYLRADSPSGSSFQNEKSKVTLGGGLVVDYFFGQNYAFSSGLWLTGKGGTISYTDKTSATNADPVRRNQEIGLQYLEVPLTVKLFTNDVATDTKVYFQLGGSVGALIGSRLNGDKRYTDPATAQETEASKHFILPDAAALVGAGVEYQLGQSTKVFAGLSYHRGLVNIEKYFDKDRGIKDVTLKNNEIALDLGLKF